MNAHAAAASSLLISAPPEYTLAAAAAVHARRRSRRLANIITVSITTQRPATNTQRVHTGIRRKGITAEPEGMNTTVSPVRKGR